MALELDQAQSAARSINRLWVIGVLGLLIGLITAGALNPGTETVYTGAAVGETSRTEATGSEVGFVVGLVVAALSQLLLLIAIIGTGVRLGVRASRALD